MQCNEMQPDNQMPSPDQKCSKRKSNLRLHNHELIRCISKDTKDVNLLHDDSVQTAHGMGACLWKSIHVMR
jgi:hypothetical protein